MSGMILPTTRRFRRLVILRLGLYPLVKRIKQILKPDFTTATPDTPPAVELCIRELIRRRTTSGDYLEFGVYKGYTLWWAMRVANRLGLKSMRVFGFDSFQGLPEPVGVDRGTRFKKGAYACPLEVVERNLTKRKVDWDRVFLVKGFYDETLNDETKHHYNIKEAAIVLIDCDLYMSTLHVLSFLKDIVRDGTILIFDDWNCFDKDPQRGERRAFTEFLNQNRDISAEELISFGWHGQSFVLHLAARPNCQQS